MTSTPTTTTNNINMEKKKENKSDVDDNNTLNSTCPNCKYHLKIEIDEDDAKKVKRITAIEKYPRKKFACLTEQNEHEGETWNFYIEYNITDKNNEKEWAKAWQTFDDALQIAQEYEDTWSLENTYISENEANFAVENGHSGYMSSDNFADSVGSVEELQKFVNCLENPESACRRDVRHWYKGDFNLECACSDNKIDHKIKKRKTSDDANDSDDDDENDENDEGDESNESE